MATSSDFDLLEEHWIPVLDRHGRARQESVRSLFRNAHELSTLAGELPTQAFAMLRLLLAVLRRSVIDRPGSSAKVWEGLWSQPFLPTAEIDAYLTTHAARFRLFDQQAPFFQVADLRAVNGKVSSLDRMIADVPNGEKYFTTRAGAAVELLEFGEAARWLVHAHAFDPSGIKTGAVGDPRVKAGKGYPIGLGWAGNLGGVFLEGATLRETLLLNLVLRDINAERFAADDLPAWERPPGRADVGRARRPTGPADLCTWQSRRIRLVHNNTHVTGAVLCNGDPLEPFNQHLLEPMTAWRLSPTQTKKVGHTRHYPLTHNPSKALWRGLTGLIEQVGVSAGIAERAIAPGLLEWVSHLLEEGVLEPTHQVRLHAVGMEYINNQSVVGDIVDDTIGFRAALLAADPALRYAAIHAAQTAEQAVTALGSLAGNLAIATGGEAAGHKERAYERGYFALETPYRRWLADLRPDAGLTACGERWQRVVDEVITSIGRGLVDSAGEPAWVGREVKGTYIDASLARIWFHARLRKLLPAAYIEDNHEKGSAA
ncbi:type I-E CRISPR-associated protein Cse1/CasA [Nocardia sp. SYP-A9097]|uniref:type I-E CRISPR-associated protein Cse1/CasA n=1 Tax=Nocardia sp. SYP-A9097 TaxID=2663237 RepID=UPI001891D991|nr:type I-E CRISPR-associated protein Cse1/CasA [Nocardia sp. SYP-A9097]